MELKGKSMKVSEFFDFKMKCPICDNYLLRQIISDVMVDNEDFSFGYFDIAGSIVYDYKKRKFVKNGSNGPYVGEHKRIMDIIRDKFPKEFSLNGKTFKPGVKKTKISNEIHPWKIVDVDFALTSSCADRSHYYFYQSKIILDGINVCNIEVDMEVIDFGKFSITYFYENNIPTKTRIQRGKGKETLTLPVIPMDKWVGRSKKKMIEQIEKYALIQ
jgi:hypothetical protein